MKSKSQTDNEILEGASKDNNEISEVRVRHSESIHPVDCSCTLCLELRFKPFSDKKEKEIVDQLDWSVE